MSLLQLEHREPGRNPVFIVEEGKPCSRPGLKVARLFEDGVICPGCDRICRLPKNSGLTRDDAFFVEKWKP